YPATEGWGFGRFVDGQPADEARHQACFACHQAHVKGHDFVFTQFAPRTHSSPTKEARS
ncbi:MAG: cytochrome P460 family protein, partial [Alphaproteobacteria bacterium]